MGYRSLERSLANERPAGAIVAGLLAVAFLAAVPHAAGQDEDESGRLVFSSGLVTESQGEDWAFVSWRATETDLLLRRPVAIYAKPGFPDEPGTYERISVADVQMEPQTLSAIMGRAERLGESREELESRIDEVFHELVPDEDMTLGEKLSAVIQGAIAEPDLQENLVWLARNSPGLAMAMGQGYAGAVDGVTTFELRELDGPDGDIVRVFGRTTVDPANPVVLPAPGRPRDVTVEDPRGHLNVRLLWAYPEALREVSLLKYGFNIYRVDREFAEMEEWDVDPPEPGELARDAEGLEEVVRVNRLPVLADETLTESEAADLAQERHEDRFFFTDDNDRRTPEDEAFQDGEQFYYFVSARDLLGRDGATSPGTLVTVCKRLPPVPPQHLDVENVYEYEAGDGEQFLRVTWRQNDENDPRFASSNYYVYRWDSLEEMHAKAGNPAENLVGGPIPHLSGAEFGQFDDTGAGAPDIETDAGRTFWYTVRAESDSVCGGDDLQDPAFNISGNSPPAFGVLRDREGPDGPRGNLGIACLLPEAYPAVDRPSPGEERTSQEQVEFHFSAQRLHPEIAWAEFFLVFGGREGDQLTSLGRVHFDREGDDLVDLRSAFHVGSDASDFDVTVACRVGTYGGRISEPASVVAFLSPGWVTEVPFMADVDLVRTAKGEDCSQHTSRDPGAPEGEGDVQPITGTIGLTPGTREWKLYRRIDDGPMRLISQGEGDFEEEQEVSWEDDAMPAAATSRICYFAQLFDEHGNASPMVRLDCVDVAHSDLPTPILTSATPLESDGDGETEIRLRWFCPPTGVERFEVWLTPAEESGDVATSSLSGPLFEEPEEIPGGETDSLHHAFQTPRVESDFGSGAEFAVTVAVEEGIQYEAVVRAVGAGGPPSADPDNQEARATGAFSNRLAFAWHEPDPDPGPEVPWPERPLPNRAALADQGDGLEMRVLDFDGFTMAIKLGEYRFEDDEGEPVFWHNVFPLDQEPEDLFFPMNGTEGPDGLFPFAVYRAFVSDAYAGPAPGTLVQVTPVMEDVAYETDYLILRRVVGNIVRDGRFIFPVHEMGEENVEQGPTHEIFFIDHHPAMAGGDYRYLLVQFRPDGEIGRVLVSPVVTFQGED